MAAATGDDERRVATEQAQDVPDEADEAEEEVTTGGFLSKHVEIFNEILFIMVSCRVIPAVIEWIFLVLEDIQFAVGVFPAPNNEGDQGFPLPLSMKIMFSFAKSSFVTYSEHVGACISSCLALSVYYFNGAYVGHKVKLGQYPEGALYTLRVFSSCNFLMLSFLKTLFSSFNCNFSTDNVLRSVTGEVVSCISGAHIAIQCVSILFLASYLMMTCNVVLKFVDFDPTYKRPSSRVHGRCDAAHIAVKAVWVILTELLSDSVISGIIVSIVCSGFMAYLFDHYRPHYNPNVNFLRFACHSSVAFFAALVGFFRLANTGATAGSTAIIMSLTALAFVLTWKLSAWRYRKRLADVPRRLQELGTLRGFRKANYLVFDSWTTVEISCRVITETMNDRRRAFDPSKANLVYAIFRQGIVEFPRSPILLLSFHLYSTFMSAAGCGEEYPLEETKELNRGFDVMFFAYVIERMNATRAQMTELGQDKILSVTKFAEYTRLETSASANHNRARKFLMMFWHTISKTPEDKETLSLALSDIQEAVNEAERSYRMLLGMYPGSAAINRAFASFLDQIKNEREAAEPYIEQADLLEGAVALQHRTVLDAEDARGQVRAPQPLNSKFGRLARPGTTKESHEKRSRAAREAAYGSSLSGHGNQRAVLIQQMSIPGRALLKKLRVYATASCVVNVGLQSWLFWTVSNVLRGESARQDYLRVLTSSQFNLARVFQTTRLMTLAVLRNDTAEFAFQKGRLAEATETLRQSIRTAYAETLINAPTLIDLMVTPSMSEKLRTFPTDVTVDETNALYLMTEKYANKAALLLDRDPARFSDALMENEIHYRYIRENYLALQAGLTTASNHYKEGLSAEISTMYWKIWVCCAVTALLVAASMVKMAGRLFREMHAYHMQRIVLLTRIPKATRKSIRDSYDISGGNGSNIKPTDVLPRGVPILRRLYLRGAAVVVSYATLTLVFGYLACATLRELSLGASDIEPQTKLLTSSLVLDLMVTELEFPETPDTWPDPSSILEYFDETLNAIETSVTSFVYKRQSAMVNTEAILTLWFGPACLIGNLTQCEATGFSPAVSFTPRAVSSGLGTLLSQYINAGQSVHETAKLGNLTNEYAPGQFIHLAAREHLTGGLSQLYTNGRLAMLTYIAQQANTLLWLFTLLIIYAVGGFRALSGVMSNWFRGKDRATDAVFLSLTPSVIKSDKVLQVYFKTGEIMDVPAPPDRGGGGIKNGPRAPGKGKEKTRGAVAGIEQNITAPVRRKNVGAPAAKEGRAPDKHLQFS